MKRHIVLFGGAFDPPHFGHLLVIEQALRQLQLDELWLMPSYASTFLKRLSPSNLRVSLTKLLAKEVNDSRIRLSMIEIDNRMSGSTIETWRYLRTTFPAEWKYSFLMGSDQLKKFHLWEDYELLLNEMQFYVYPRMGYPMEPWFNQMKQLDSEIISDVSSTEVRNRIRKGQQISDLVPRTVEQYIATHLMYRD